MIADNKLAQNPGWDREMLHVIHGEGTAQGRRPPPAGRTAVDLAPQIIAPMLYAYETIPSALNSDQIAAVLKTTHEDPSPMGLRDCAILLLLSKYGMRVLHELRPLEDVRRRPAA